MINKVKKPINEKQKVKKVEPTIALAEKDKDNKLTKTNLPANLLGNNGTGMLKNSHFVLSRILKARIWSK